MADPIKLPPLPENMPCVQELRARDLEVVRVVLEAAAKACDMPGPWHNYATASEAKAAIRALEFHHG